jgi:hypothetical protein
VAEMRVRRSLYLTCIRRCTYMLGLVTWRIHVKICKLDSLLPH